MCPSLEKKKGLSKHKMKARSHEKVDRLNLAKINIFDKG